MALKELLREDPSYAEDHHRWANLLRFSSKSAKLLDGICRGSGHSKTLANERMHVMLLLPVVARRIIRPLWDREGELLAISVDSLLCEAEIQRLRHVALTAQWDDKDYTLWRFENNGTRQHTMFQPSSRSRYKGAFPGVTGRSRIHEDDQHSIQNLMVECLGEFTLWLARVKSKRLRWLYRDAKRQTENVQKHLIPNLNGAFFASVCLRPKRAAMVS